MDRPYARAFAPQCRLWGASVAEPGQRGQRADAGTGAAQPVRLRRPWRAIYTGFALAAPDGRAAGHVAPQGGARRAEGGTGEARRALCAVGGGENASPIPPHREMGRGSRRRMVEGNGARPPTFAYPTDRRRVV